MDDLLQPRGESEECSASRVRRFYTDNFKALDQLDAEWYRMSYQQRDGSWQACLAWAMILNGVVNSRSAYCELTGTRETTRGFAESLRDELAALE